MQPKTKLNVASLNFSGINTNPFEYDDGSKMMVEFNQNIKSIMAIEEPNFKKWICAKLDKQYKKDRVSVCLEDQIPLINQKFPNKAQFSELWKKYMQKAEFNGSIKYDPSKDEIEDAIKMDYLFFRAIFMHVYHSKQAKTQEDLQALEEQIQTQDPQVMLKFLREQKNRPACKLNIKRNITMEYFKNKGLDLLCLQEATAITWEDIQTQQIGVTSFQDSVIIYKRKVFGNPIPKMNDFYKHIADFNKDTAILFTDLGYFILSVHLSSKEINIQQAQEMFKKLGAILNLHKQKVIIGIDANQFLQINSIPFEGFLIIPQNKEKPTTNKKRSFMQAQLKKAGLSDVRVKDHMLTNLKINSWKCQNADGNESLGELIPNDIHPFDHYILRAELEL